MTFNVGEKTPFEIAEGSFFTEQLAPDKEAILQIERNEFVPQSFNSSAATKGTQVISTYLLIL